MNLSRTSEGIRSGKVILGYLGLKLAKKVINHKGTAGLLKMQACSQAAKMRSHDKATVGTLNLDHMHFWGGLS